MGLRGMTWVALLVLGITADAEAQVSYSQRTVRSAGPIGVRRIGGEPQRIHVRAQWANGGYLWSKVRGPMGMAALELDLGAHVTLRGTVMAGRVAPASNGSDQVPMVFGDVGLFLHRTRWEGFREHMTLDYSSSSSTSTVGRTTTTRTSSRELYVEVPAARLRMRGLNVGAFAYWGMGHPGDGNTPDPNDVYAPVLMGGAYAGYSQAFVKSTAYRIDGYGVAGGARFHRLYADLMVAPLRDYTEGQSEVDDDVFGQLLGARFGVENVWGKRWALACRAEGGVLPGRLGAYFLVTLGLGSNLVTR
ncbi:MAG: hypothetical protein AAGH15_19565 [Myxococcota bacterium]